MYTDLYNVICQFYLTKVGKKSYYGKKQTLRITLFHNIIMRKGEKLFRNKVSNIT